MLKILIATGFTKQSLGIGVNGFNKLHKQICAANAPKKAEFLKRTQWIKKDDVDELYTCAAMASKVGVLDIRLRLDCERFCFI